MNEASFLLFSQALSVEFSHIDEVSDGSRESLKDFMIGKGLTRMRAQGKRAFYRFQGVLSLVKTGNLHYVW